MERVDSDCPVKTRASFETRLAGIEADGISETWTAERRGRDRETEGRKRSKAKQDKTDFASSLDTFIIHLENDIKK